MLVIVRMIKNKSRTWDLGTVLAPGVWCSEVLGSSRETLPVGDGLTSTKRSGQISQVAASGRAECWMAKATTIVAIHYQKWGESFWSPLACKNDCSLSHLDRLTFPLPIIYGPGVLHYLSPAVPAGRCSSTFTKRPTHQFMVSRNSSQINI